MSLLIDNFFFYLASRQMYWITFKPGDIIVIEEHINGLTSSKKLIVFSQISMIIVELTELLPSKLIPYIQQLTTFHSQTIIQIRTQLTDMCSLLTNFLIKFYHVMKRGMDDNDRKGLEKFRDRYENLMVDIFGPSFDLSRDQLIKIYNDLLQNAGGKRVKTLLEEKNSLESNLMKSYEKLMKIQIKLEEVKHQMKYISYKISILSQTVYDHKRIQLQIDQELTELKEQISVYEQKTVDYQIIETDEQQIFSIFSWKVQNMIDDQNEKLAKKNLTKRLDRIRDLEKLRTMNFSNFNDEIIRLTNESDKYLTTIIGLQKDQESTNKSCQENRKTFQKILQELQNMMKTIDTGYLKKLEKCHEIAVDMFTGKNIVNAARGRLYIYLKTAVVSNDYLLSSMKEAIDFINMVDSYMGTEKIQNLKELLGLE